jgi:hypothetical protein
MKSKASIKRSLLRNAASVGLLAGIVVSVNSSALAVGTRHFELDSKSDFLGGDLKGVAVDSQGHVRAGWNLGKRGLQKATSVWDSLAMTDGSVLLATGNTGKILQVKAGKVTEYADTKQMAVTSLAIGHGGKVYAATLPEGKIFRVDGPGKLTELPKIPGAKNIWALAWDAKGKKLYAATGPEGRLFVIGANGNATLFYKSDEPNLVSVTVAPDGTVYAGSSGKALIFKITGAGRATILHDCKGQEAKALVFSKGSLFAICNEFSSTSVSSNSRFLSLRPAGPQKHIKPKVGKGRLMRIEPTGISERLYYDGTTHFMSLAVDDSGIPHVGAADKGHVFRVDANRTVTVMAETDERQVGTMVLAGKTKFIATSDPAVFHEIQGTGGNDAIWTSKVLDAGLRATFGRLFWRADGSIQMMSRTGNSEVPDATWSDWSAAANAPGKIKSPAARYVQIRARFTKGNQSVLNSVRLSFVTDNLRAVLIDVDTVSPKAKTTSGSKIPSSGSAAPSANNKVKVSWKVDNPDNDKLRYFIKFKFEGQSTWHDMIKSDDVYTKSDISWDTNSLPEGMYRIKVTATDELANPPDKVLTHTYESGAILVDNTPPVFRSLRANGRRIVADIVDGIGPISYIDFSVDGQSDWRPLLSKDGVLDEASENVDADVSSVVGAGRHLVAVRAYDSAGNFVVRNVEFK